jgi:hypothetical protein
MMRVLRATMYPSPNVGARLTTVIRECDLNCPLAEAVADATAPLDPPAFIATEIFAVPEDTSIEAATLEAKRRLGERLDRECNQAIGFFYYAQALTRCAANGVVSATAPAPLDADELAEIAAALAKHPAYRRQTVVQIAEDGRVVRLTAGKVAVEDQL